MTSMASLTKLALQYKFLDVYRACKQVPLLGGHLFTLYIRVAAPYSGSVAPRITRFEHGDCRIELEERWRLQNPFQSIHALALLNAGELSTGMAFLSLTQDLERRAIITKLSGEYKKKARGMVYAECVVPEETRAWLRNGGEGPVTVRSEIKDFSGDVVAVCDAEWMVAPVKKTIKAAEPVAPSEQQQ
ncbi:hypothetical protein H9P43_003455 [Blastocladiella emersonii ATCC 22665]|nr:hypothetical protein H9P43_003455 [Blastocladiella emersonii ATCC 22665]